MQREHDDDDLYGFSDYSQEEYDDADKVSHKRQVRRMLEDRLERKRLKEELDEIDSDFDWDDYDR
jgi:hypothetical protein